METQVRDGKRRLQRFKAFLVADLSPAMKVSLLSCIILALAFGGAGFFTVVRHYRFLPSAAFVVIFIVFVVLVSVAATLLLVLIKNIQWQEFFVITAAALSTMISLLLFVYLIPLIIFTAIGVYFAFMSLTGKYKPLRKLKKIPRYVIAVVANAVAVFLLVLIFWPGPSLYNNRPETARLALPYADSIARAATPALRNPSLPGSYNHTIYFYATPGQRADPFPGQDVLPASTADASEILRGWGRIRRRQLGFEPDALPLNAQVWMPEGSGPFPIALIVHGNHPAGNRSDIGYGYLGELLASRGIIMASVDQNFINSSLIYDAFLFGGGLQAENGARGFILLEHLRQWYEWNADIFHPFYNKADFGRIVLIGHSRGGEAAVLAAAFADLGHYPGNGNVTFDYPFSINTVIAIAPVHRQYNPAELEVYLRNINYLVLHGGHDKDVSSFMGADMYRRADVSEYGIKAAVWIKHANHGQFNTAWGRNDLPGLSSFALNRRLLMPEEEQQTVGKVFISAFLEAVLFGRNEYTALFRDFTHGADWLPAALYITDFADSSMQILDSFDGGFDLTMSSSGLVRYSAEGFSGWTVMGLPSKFGGGTNRVLALQWGPEEDGVPPVFVAEFADSAIYAGDRLYMSLSSGNSSYDDPDVAFGIRLTDVNGYTATMHINDFGGVVNPIDAHIFSPIMTRIAGGGTSEPVLQMVSIPTEYFEGLQGGIVSMEWVFDVAEVGQILYVDDLRVSRQ